MSAINRAVNHSLFPIQFVGKVLLHAYLDTLHAPTGKVLVDRVPFAVFSRQQPTLRTAASRLEDDFHKAATFTFILADVGIRVAAQEIPYLCPLTILESHCCHETSLSLLLKRQYYPRKLNIDRVIGLAWCNCTEFFHRRVRSPPDVKQSNEAHPHAIAMDIINREEELAHIEELIASIGAANQQPEQCMLEVIGISGSGKTVVLRKARELTEGYPVRVIFIDFAGYQYRNSSPPHLQVLFGQELLEQLTLDLESINHASEILNDIKVTDKDDPANELFETLIQAIASDSMRGGGRYLFVLDSLDRLSDQLISWIEQKVFLPLLGLRPLLRFAVLLASRHPIEWHEYATKTSRAVLTVEPFSAEETQEQIEKKVGTKLAKRIYETTGGHPSLNEFVSNRLREIEKDLPEQINEISFSAYEARLVQDLVHSEIARIMGGVPSNVSDLFRYVSVASFFDLDLLELILKFYFPNRQRMPTALIRIQSQMVSPRWSLASWDTRKNGVVINSIVRKILSLDLRLNQTPLYQVLCESVLSSMLQRVESDYKPVEALAEILLQKANILSLSGTAYIDELLSIVKEFLATKCRGRFGLDTAYELAQHIDKFVELKVRLGQDQTQKILDSIYNFIETETFEREKQHQKAYLSIYKQETEGDFIPYHISLTLPGLSQSHAQSVLVPKVIRRDLLAKLSSIESFEQMKEIAMVLYRQFIPEHARSLLASLDVPLCINTDDNELPWELMYDAEKSSFLCRGLTIARVISTIDEMEKTVLPTKLARGMLLIANPTEDVSLTEAESEINEVAQLGQTAGFIPEVLLGKDANIYKVSLELGRGTYGLIHYVGHAVFDEYSGQNSALLLHDGYYPAASIAQVLSGTPFVFLNACSSGKSERVVLRTWRWGTETTGLASAFMKRGAIGCIGSLWRISDNPAEKFAKAFYSSAFSGNTVGLALKEARLAFAQEDLTWASYILYGNPTSRLAQPKDMEVLDAVRPS